LLLLFSITASPLPFLSLFCVFVLPILFFVFVFDDKSFANLGG